MAERTRIQWTLSYYLAFYDLAFWNFWYIRLNAELKHFSKPSLAYTNFMIHYVLSIGSPFVKAHHKQIVLSSQILFHWTGRSRFSWFTILFNFYLLYFKQNEIKLSKSHTRCCSVLELYNVYEIFKFIFRCFTCAL